MNTETVDILLMATWSRPCDDNKCGAKVIRIRCTKEQHRALFYQGTKEIIVDKKTKSGVNFVLQFPVFFLFPLTMIRYLFFPLTRVRDS